MFNLKPTKYDIRNYEKAQHKGVALNEIFGRKIFAQAVMNKKYDEESYLFTQAIYEDYDIELSTEDGRKIFEIKIRDKEYDNMILECDKYYRMKSHKNHMYYVNITTDTNTIYVWDLKKTNPEYLGVDVLNCPSTTHTHNTIKKNKAVFNLPLSSAFKYTVDESIKDMRIEFEKQLNNN